MPTSAGRRGRRSLRPLRGQPPEPAGVPPARSDSGSSAGIAPRAASSRPAPRQHSASPLRRSHQAGNRRARTPSGSRRRRSPARRSPVADRQPVAHLDRGEGVEAELVEGSVGRDLLGGGMAEDGGRLAADQIQNHGLALGLGQGGELGRPARSPPSGAAAPARDQLAQDRRQGTGVGERLQAGGIDVDRKHQGLLRRQRRVEEGEAVLVGDRQRRRCGAPAPCRSRRARPSCRSPRPRGPRPSRSPAAPAPVGAGRGRRGRRSRRRSWPGRGRRARPPSRRRGRRRRGRDPRSARAGARRRRALGAKTRLQLLGVHRLDHAVVERPGGVDHGAERVLGVDRAEQRLERVAIADVAGRDAHLGPQLGQVRGELGSPLGPGAAAADQQQMANRRAARPGDGRAGRRDHRCRP